MKTFGEFHKNQRIEESLTPEIRDILKKFDDAAGIADKKNMLQTLQAIEDARQTIITLQGK